MSRFTAFGTKAGTVHLTVQAIDLHGAKPTLKARGLCGRVLNVQGTYDSDAIPAFAEEHGRLGLTHETGLCRICFDKYNDIEKG